MKKLSFITQSVFNAATYSCGVFTILVVWSHYRGGYQFWDSVYSAVFAGIGMAIYKYWRAWRGRGNESRDPSADKVLLKEHPLLIRSFRTGLIVACAAFTLLITLAHFRGAYEFWKIVYVSAAGGAAGSIEGYRRALQERAGKGRQM